MVTSRGHCKRRLFPDCCCPVPHPSGSPCGQASTGDPPTLASSSGSVCYEAIALSSGSLVCTRFCLCSLTLGLRFPQSCGSPLIQSCWLQGSDFQENSQSLKFRSLQARKYDMEPGPSLVGELLRYYRSPTWVTLGRYRRIWVHCECAPLLFLSLDREYPFYWVPASSCHGWASTAG